MLSIAIFGIGVVLILALGRIAAATVMQARAAAAADAAALAAADALALGRGGGAAVEAAREMAAANGGEMQECDCSGLSAEVVVSVAAPPGPMAVFGPATSRARAEVDPSPLLDLGG